MQQVRRPKTKARGKESCACKFFFCDGKSQASQAKNNVCYIKTTYSFIMKKRKQPQEQTTTNPINMQIPNSAFKTYSILKPVYPLDQLKKRERERKKKNKKKQ